MIKAIMFDLDGTLLCMDNMLFIKYYYKLLTKRMAKYGYDANELIENVTKATYKVMANDGFKTNRECFFENFIKYMGDKLHTDINSLECEFNDFYNNEFNEIKKIVGENKEVNEILDYVRNLNLKVIVATTPVFPYVAVDNRLAWINEKIDNFDYVSTYENSHYAKPNPKYYLELLEKNDLKIDEVIMVGNDMIDDIKPCLELGIKCFFLDNYALNEDSNINVARGDFKALKAYVDNQIGIK